MVLDNAPPIFNDAETAEVMLVDLNEVRGRLNLPAVKLRADLTCAAGGWAQKQAEAGSCGHTDPATRSEFPSRVAACGGAIAGGWEMVGCNMPDFTYAVGSWLRERTTRSALYHPGVEFVGLGLAQGLGGQNWYVLLVEAPRREP